MEALERQRSWTVCTLYNYTCGGSGEAAVLDCVYNYSIPVEVVERQLSWIVYVYTCGFGGIGYRQLSWTADTTIQLNLWRQWRGSCPGLCVQLQYTCGGNG